MARSPSSSRPATPAEAHSPPIDNLVLLSGSVVKEPERRSLRSGVDVVNFDVSTQVGDEHVSVPIAWHDPSERAVSSFAAGEHVVIVGTVRRRFFRAGGQTQSRTEVVVDSLVPARRAKSSRSLRAAAAAAITPAGGSPVRSAASG